MAKAKFDIKTLELPAVAAKPLYAGVGATDLAVEYVREYVADVQKKFAEVQKDVQTRVAGVQKNVKGFEFEPKALREQTVTVVNSRVVRAALRRQGPGREGPDPGRTRTSRP